mmetsp:Transcript_18808/g.34891  ORF Transcript_18808/g.34891 Transcript_18808/m.34891 type:complete len:227 (-) Transcript_18808:470-1150(-)
MGQLKNVPQVMDASNVGIFMWFVQLWPKKMEKTKAISWVSHSLAVVADIVQTVPMATHRRTASFNSAPSPTSIHRITPLAGFSMKGCIFSLHVPTCTRKGGLRWGTSAVSATKPEFPQPLHCRLHGLLYPLKSQSLDGPLSLSLHPLYFPCCLRNLNFCVPRHARQYLSPPEVWQDHLHSNLPSGTALLVFVHVNGVEFAVHPANCDGGSTTALGMIAQDDGVLPD